MQQKSVHEPGDPRNKWESKRLGEALMKVGREGGVRRLEAEAEAEAGAQDGSRCEGSGHLPCFKQDLYVQPKHSSDLKRGPTAALRFTIGCGLSKDYALKFSESPYSQ